MRDTFTTERVVTGPHLYVQLCLEVDELTFVPRLTVLVTGPRVLCLSGPWFVVFSVDRFRFN